ncbi:DeoR/GlpR family DNA-binding transcription regulator [Phytoactinopolyspora halophila]|uniref:DeoR/GlpR family DNA-binding transcription regulator n=1 Tax=Phytoactinopolyspora halophila TaxID=1981511 RepID=UPI0013DE1A1A|nr:DeoR/GlpR family DNA-binding transcription regulator [Phytoactinopolyspora halophila]
MKTERHRAIIERLDTGGDVSVAELVEMFDVSEMTIRRDLFELERTGVLRRVHGGATPVGGRAYEPPFRVREGQQPDRKQAIATAAAGLVTHGDAIGLDVGSTVLMMADSLASVRQLTIVTASLRVAWAVASSHALEQSARLIVTGGVVRAEELSMTGQAAADRFRSMRLDKAFVGVGGLSPAVGATEFNLEDAEVKKVMIRSARKVIVLADTSKLGNESFAHVAAVDDIDVLVTDAAADHPAVVEFERAGVEVVTARPSRS